MNIWKSCRKSRNHKFHSNVEIEEFLQRFLRGECILKANNLKKKPKYQTFLKKIESQEIISKNDNRNKGQKVKIIPSIMSTYGNSTKIGQPDNCHQANKSFDSSIKANLQVYQNHRKQAKINIVFYHFPLLGLSKPPWFGIFQIRQLN